ncbi:MAG: bifunctional ornithine acetyltransferase/N-acetylglutamate synthase, partial [Oscillospiraceae bacterium]|nr:bifunctional ornithine acetyltransferase/N-acetylglutamate synthase [Oscillospiraceae bacterium]
MKLQTFPGYTFTDGGVCAAQGFKANGVCCGLKHNALPDDTASEQNLAANNALPEEENAPKKNDLAMILADCPCNTAAVYTSNKVKGAPILVTKEHLKNGIAQAVIVNSVNANTCNVDGVEKAEKMCELAAKALRLDAEDVVVAST